MVRPWMGRRDGSRASLNGRRSRIRCASVSESRDLKKEGEGYSDMTFGTIDNATRTILLP
jgi:hypothetical protein